MPTPDRESRLLKALRRRFKTPQAVFARLGIDSKLLARDEADLQSTSYEIPFKPTYSEELIAPAGEQAWDDEEEVKLGQILRKLPREALRALLECDDLDEFKEMIADALEGMAPPDEDELTEDDPPPFPGQPNTGATMNPLDQKGPRERIPAVDSSFNRLYPSAARIEHSPFGSVTPAEREALAQHRPRRIAIAKDRAPRKAPSFNAMFPDAKRIGHLG